MCGKEIDPALHQIFLHAGDDLLGAAELNHGYIFDRLEAVLSQNVARDEVGEGPKARDPDGFAFERRNVGDRRGRKKRSLSGVVLAPHHHEIGAGEIGVDNRAGGGVNNIDIAGEQRLHRRCARADEQQLHIDAVFLIEPGLLADPENCKGSGKGGVSDAQLLRARTARPG